MWWIVGGVGVGVVGWVWGGEGVVGGGVGGGGGGGGAVELVG